MKRSKKEAVKTVESKLRAAGWLIQDADDLKIPSFGGLSVCDVRLSRNYGMADMLLYVDGKVAGLIEIDTQSNVLFGVDPQIEKYRLGLPIILPVYTRPLPFLYQSNGEEIRFTNAFDAEPRARALFAFHKPETLKAWLEDGMIGSMPRDMAAAESIEHGRRGATLQERLWINMPPLIEDGLSLIQCDAINALEQSLKKNNPRVLIQMKDATERKATALHLINRLIRFADARRVLYLVNSENIGREIHKRFQDCVSPYDKKALTQTLPVQHVTDNQLDLNARICIATLPRMYDLLTNETMNEKGSEKSPEEILETVAPLQYNPDIPIGTFDIVVIDTCSAPLTRHFRRVLGYFDAYVIGMSGKADEKTVELFDGNLLLGDEKDENGGLVVISEV
ncbi:MAG: DEAD/DEAH box helicase family protein [Nitrospiria bacterium]